MNKEADLPAPLYEAPLKVSVNLEKGYHINPTTGDSIRPVINSFGDTVRTGEEIQLADLPEDTTPWIPPATILLKDPVIISAHQNCRQLSNQLLIKKLNPDILKATYARESQNFILINSTGDTIPTDTPRFVSAKVQSLPRSRPVQALLARQRDNVAYDIQCLDIEQGLSSSTVMCMLPDTQGGMWIGTDAGGLNRYDGASFDIRKFAGGEYVRFIFKDSRHRIWYGGPDGLNCYDGKQLNVFTESQGLPVNWITSIIQDKNGLYWIGTFGGGLIRYAEKNDTSGYFTHYTIREGLPSNFINILFIDRKGELLIGTRDAGIVRVRLVNDHAPDLKNAFHLHRDVGLSHNNIWKIIEDSKDGIWIATLGGLNYLKNSEDGQPGIIVLSKKDGLPDNIIYSIILDKEENLWCGSANGVFKIQFGGPNSLEGSSIIHYGQKEGLSDNDVMSLCFDDAGNLWCGTYGGINKINKGSLVYFADEENPLSDGAWTMMEASDSSLWFAPFGHIVHYEAKSVFSPGKFTVYGMEQGLPNPVIRDIMEDQEGNVWLSTNAGLCILETKIQPARMTCYTKEQGLTANVIRTAMQDDQGKIWVGTHGGGVNCLERKDGSDPFQFSVTRITDKEGLANNFIRSILQDAEGNLWFATIGGLSRLRYPSLQGNGTILNYSEREGLPMNYLSSLLEDANGYLWISSDKGIVQLDKRQPLHQQTFTIYTEKQGLSDNWTWKIFSDDSGRKHHDFWVPGWTGINLIRHDSSSQQVYKFDRHDGIRGTYSVIWDKGAMLDRQNRLWWGREKGVEMLDLNHFELSSKVPEPAMRHIEVNGSFVDFENLPDSLSSTCRFDSIQPGENYPVDPTFSFNNNHLTFYFSAIDWSAPEKIKYSYNLVSTDNKWSIPSDETKAEYRNLPPGKHIFKIRAIGESQIWSQPIQYAFTIRPPLYRSMAAYVFYLIVLSTFLYSVYRFQLNRKLEKEEQKRLLELDTLKNRLYANITHEFRTPLTLIHGPVSQALTSHQSLDQEDLKSIHRQSVRLQELITQMLDLHKVEAGKLSVHYRHGDIVQQFRYIVSLFESWARDKNIDFVFDSEVEELYMDFDDEKLTQIVSNLLSNAIKHTPRGGRISLDLKVLSAGQTLEIKIQDTGTGISPEDLPYIFNRYYQSALAATGGTGIGLELTKMLVELLGGSIRVESKWKEGSDFIVKLPISNKAAAEVVMREELKQNIEPYDDELKFLPPVGLLTDRPLVLIVEDHPEVLRFIANCLKNDYSVMTATDGDEGIQKAFEHIPDMVISDVMMPGKDGFELCAILKKDMQTSHIPVILLTGRGDQAALMEGIEQGADAYVIKPFEPSELLLRVKKLLELRISLREHYRKNAQSEESKLPALICAKEHAFLEKIRSFIEEHINDPELNMHMLTRHMAMSHPQLHRKITALTGESTGKFVRSVRLAKAIELLKNSDLTVSEIAYETGFSEPGYFTKVFSKEYNMTPTDFRARSLFS